MITPGIRGIYASAAAVYIYKIALVNCHFEQRVSHLPRFVYSFCLVLCLWM